MKVASVGFNLHEAALVIHNLVNCCKLPNITVMIVVALIHALKSQDLVSNHDCQNQVFTASNLATYNIASSRILVPGNGDLAIFLILLSLLFVFYIYFFPNQQAPFQVQQSLPRSAILGS